MQSTDLTRFFADPYGRYVDCGRCAYFWADRTLSGTLAWGTPTEQDVRKLVQAYDAELAEHAPPRLSFVDLSRLEAIAPAAFAQMTGYFHTNTPRLRGLILKQALVRPPGIAGAVVAGFYELVSAVYPVKVFSDADAALAWLGYGPAAQLLDGLRAVHREASGVGPTTRAVRAQLVDLKGVSIRAVAKALALSERTLQRRLAEENTSFQGELNAAQVRAAKKLLRETELKLTDIAMEVGCVSLQHFSDLFRRLEGMPPSEYRKA